VTDERTLAYLQELAQADEAAANVLAALDGQAHEVERIGAEATRLRERLAALPVEREKARAAREEAGREAEERRREHEAAAAALAALEGDRHAERVAAARRDELRARDLSHAAERKLAVARAEEEQLAREDAEDKARAEAFAEEARVLAVATGHGEPEVGLDAIAAWATETRAALFVARSGRLAEREALIRQATELGTSVLGEPIAAQSPAELARRLR